MFDIRKHIKNGKQLLLAAALSPVLLAGCITEDGACPDDIGGGNGTWLSMRVVNADSQTGRTRADDDAGHPDEAATDPENYIDGSDMTIMLLDNRQMVRHIFTPDEITLSTSTSGNNVFFDLKFKLKADYFSYAGPMTSVDFSLMVVANRTGLGGETSAFGSDLLSKTPLMIAQGYPSFTMPGQTTSAWMPDGSTQRIPMSGIMAAKGMNLSVANTVDNPLDVGTIYLQRNLCKVRILGDLDGLDGGSEFKDITSVRLIGANGKGAFIPVVAEGDGSWYSGTKVLETPTVKSDWWNAGAEVTMLAAPQTSVVYNKTYDNAFYCYVPEAELTGKGAKLEIKANYKSNNTIERTWVLSLGTANDGTDNGYIDTRSFVRNHIYEYLVQSVGSSELQITWTVCNMDTGEANIEFN